ncbi:MAG: hypothetical protein NVSMB21_07110 [Vulcanimicrobiaceae bacterium]
MFVAEDLDRLSGLGELYADGVHLIDFLTQVGELLHRLLRRIGVVPEILRARALIEFRYRAAFTVVVKDAPEARRGVRRAGR